MATYTYLNYHKVNDVDADGNGNIDFDEFLSLVKTLKTENDTDDLQEAFK
jgi:Ca2+-binding EF-hand superfamily protein